MALRAQVFSIVTSAARLAASDGQTVKHASPIALDALEPLLQQLRSVGAITERRRGVFYRKSSAFLHFHEDPAGFFADLKAGPTWQRLPATTARDRRAIIAAVRKWA